MKTVVIPGADSMGMVVAGMLNLREMKLVGLGDTRTETRSIFPDLEEGELKEEIQSMPVMPVDPAIALQPDVIVVTTTDPEKSHALQYMAVRVRFLDDIIFIRGLCQQLSAACNVLRRICRRLIGLCIGRDVAGLGCYHGDTPWQPNILMSDRRLYLSDTFEGFDPRDTAKGQELTCSSAETGQLPGMDEEKLMERMPMKEQVIIRKSWFPEIVFDMEGETSALVYMDICLYNPTLSELEFFLSRIARGGVVLLKGDRHVGYGGVAKAVEDLGTKYGALPMLPADGLSNVLMIVHP